MTKALNLVKHLAAAAEGTSVTTPAIEHVRKVRAMAAHPSVGKHTLHAELQKLEKSLSHIADVEQQILTKEDADVAALKSELRDVKVKLSLGESASVQKRLDRIQFLLSELAARFDAVASMKEERSERMAQLEKKIQASIDRNFKEIRAIEDMIGSLEQRYDSLKKGQNIDQDHLKTIESKLQELRDKLLQKKMDIVDKRKAEVEGRAVGIPSHMEEDVLRDEPALPQEKMFDKSSLGPGAQSPREMFTSKPIPPPTLRGGDDETHTMLFPPTRPGEEPAFPMTPSFEDLPPPPAELPEDFSIPPPPVDLPKGLGDLPPIPTRRKQLGTLPPPPSREHHRSGLIGFWSHLFKK
jgi:hypothetical protein